MLLSKIKLVGHSMEPTLKDGDTVLVSSFLYFFWKPKVGDIVLLQHGRYIIKRIAKIDKNKVFIQGDNKKLSTDSRDFGWINKKEIVGKVMLKI